MQLHNYFAVHENDLSIFKEEAGKKGKLVLSKKDFVGPPQPLNVPSEQVPLRDQSRQ